MNYDLVIATTTCFSIYGHIPDEEYRRKLWGRFLSSLANTTLIKHRFTHLVSEDTGIGWNANYFKVLNEATSIAPLCLIADSDAYFHPDWLVWLYEAMRKYPDAAGWSLYNSPRNITFVRDLEPGIFEKSHSCPHGLVYRTADRPVSEVQGWFEEFITAIAGKHSMGFVTPTVSMIQHAGLYGLNNIPKGSEDYDPLFPLNNECLTLDFPGSTIHDKETTDAR